jgi:hypothetical protein
MQNALLQSAKEFLCIFKIDLCCQLYLPVSAFKNNLEFYSEVSMHFLIGFDTANLSSHYSTYYCKHKSFIPAF